MVPEHSLDKDTEPLLVAVGIQRDRAWMQLNALGHV